MTLLVVVRVQVSLMRFTSYTTNVNFVLFQCPTGHLGRSYEAGSLIYTLFAISGTSCIVLSLRKK